MTSIVITPFDSEHAAELRDFIWNELENADFDGATMPAGIELVDVQALKAQRDRLLEAMACAIEAIEYYDRHEGAKEMLSMARKAMQLTKGTE